MPAITRHERRKEGSLQIKEIIVVVVVVDGGKGLKVSWRRGNLSPVAVDVSLNRIQPRPLTRRAPMLHLKYKA